MRKPAVSRRCSPGTDSGPATDGRAANHLFFKAIPAKVDTHGLTPVVLGSQRPALPQSDAFAPALTHGVHGGLESLIIWREFFFTKALGMIVALHYADCGTASASISTRSTS